jgi:hypothetical protein
LLLILLPVFAGVPGSGSLLAVCCLVVLVSVLLHGFSPMFVFRPAARPAVAGGAGPHPHVAAAANGVTAAAPVAAGDASPDPYIDTVTLRRAMESEAPPVLVDSRSARSFEESDELLDRAVRLDPDRPAAEAERLGLPRDAMLAVFCA